MRNTATSSSIPAQIRDTVELDTPGLAAERPDQVIDLPGGRAGDVGGHDHPPQGLVDLPAGFEQRREERDAQSAAPRRACVYATHERR